MQPMEKTATGFKALLATVKLSNSDAADRLGVPVGTLKAALSRDRVPEDWFERVVAEVPATVTVEPETILQPAENTRWRLQPLRVCKGPPKVQGWHVCVADSGNYPALGEGSKLTIWASCETNAEAHAIVDRLRGVSK